MDWQSMIGLDRQWLLFFNGSDSLFLDGLAQALTTASTWIPLYIALFYLVLKNNDAVAKILLILCCAGLCVFLAGSLDDMLVKPLMARWRPTHDEQIGVLIDTVDGYRGGNYGFFSAHAANTFSLAVFFVLLVRSKLLSITLVVWSLINCWTRMYLGVHFPGDILCGLLWGGIVGTLIWLLHYYVRKRLTESKRFISNQYTTTGYLHSDVDVVATVFLFTIFCTILKACFSLYM